MITTKYKVIKDKKKRNRISIKDYGICPDCKTGNLVHKDFCDRICKDIGGKKKIYQIPRGICENCGRIHRIIPDFMVPFGQYSKKVVEQVKNGDITIEDALDFPCDMTIQRWTKKKKH